MLFVLDGSGSIQSDNFLLMKEFVKDIVGSSNVGDDEVRIGLIRYSTLSELQFGLGTHNTIGSVSAAIDDVSYDGGSTASDLALRVGYVNLISVKFKKKIIKAFKSVVLIIVCQINYKQKNDS